MQKLDAVVIGAGCVGLALTRELAKRGARVACLEQASRWGEGITSRNSEVVHAGIYYGDALPRKLRACVRGRELLYAYCAERQIPHAKLGKLVVAQAGNEAGLDLIARQAAAAGVLDLRRLDATEVADLEPNVCAAAALLSPSTGVVDSAAFCDALRDDCVDLGAIVATGHRVEAVDAEKGVLQVSVDSETMAVEAKAVANCAGLFAPLLARQAGLDVSSLFARGSYYALKGDSPFSRLVYPLPEPGGLGVHATLDLGGRCRFGPDVEWLPAGTLPDAPGLFEVDPARAAPFYAAVRTYWPALADGALAPDYVGVRPKLSRTAADFQVVRSGRVLHLLGIESPGLTACLALAEEACDAVLNPRRGQRRVALATPPDPTRARPTSSQYYGVRWHAPTKKWIAFLDDANGRHKHLGLFADEAAAALARDDAICRLGLARKLNADKSGTLVPKPRPSSRYLGVAWHAPLKRWSARYKLNGKNTHVGYFADEGAAALAYNASIEKAGLNKRRNPVDAAGKLVPKWPVIRSPARRGRGARGRLAAAATV